MVCRKVQEESLVAVADAIRNKCCTTEPLVFPEGFIEAVKTIQGGGITVSHDGNGNVVLNGVSATDDGGGNIVIS